MIYKLSETGVILTDETGVIWSIPNNPDLSMWRDYLKWLSEGNTPEPADPEPEPVKSWTPYEFQKRFTRAERIAIISSIDVYVKDFWSMAISVQEIIADNPDTVNGMNYLVSIGLLTEVRKTEILS